MVKQVGAAALEHLQKKVELAKEQVLEGTSGTRGKGRHDAGTGESGAS
jgi:hypothetical protein